MRYLLLIATALTFPDIAMAASDCGDEASQTAEVAMAIQTPEQFAAPSVELEVPGLAVDTVAPTRNIAPEPATIQVAQSEPEAAPPSAETQAAPVEAYAALLQKRISRGEGGLNLFDYAGVHSSGGLKVITAYTDHLASQNPDAMNQADQIAYWANLYNGLTLKVVLENYPVSSIRKIKSGAFSAGPWDRDAVSVNGKTLTLNDIEHEILRKRYPNPSMVHYMVNCASIGCPNLLDKPWAGETLEADREQAARDYINSPRGVAIDGKDLEVSSIYKWFQEDFGGSKSGVVEHVKKFAGPELLAAIESGAKIDGFEYDWSLNE